MAENVQKSLNLRAFREAYATEFHLYLEANETDIDFHHGLAPARFTDVGLTTAEGAYHKAPERVLPDTGGGAKTRWYTLHRVGPPCRAELHHKSHGPAGHGNVIGGVGTGAAVSTETVTIKGPTIGGVRVPTLKNIPVVPGFEGLLLQNVFN